MKKFLGIIVLFSSVLFLNLDLYSQEKIVLSGKVYNSFTKKAVEFGSVVVFELGIKVWTDPEGNYSIEIPKEGLYTIYVSSHALETLKLNIEITNSMTKDFTLSPAKIQGAAITIRGERDIQKVSRRTMTVEDLKEVPASLGDSINALTSLPGVDRTSGFFGPLVIRGIDAHRNRYYVDDIPIYQPMHFGGLHSVLANELMSEIDLYSSSFPAKYGGALAAVIEINTLDAVKEFGGYLDLSLITATALIKMPLTKTVAVDDNLEEENAGYIIASGRIGYLTLVIPYIYKLATDEKLTWLPEYYDYQFKTKYFLNKRNSVTLLIFGGSDYWKMAVDDAADINPDNGDDPLLQDLQFKIDASFHNFGAFYTYDTGLFTNKLMAYASLSKQYTYIDAGPDAASWLQDYYVDSRPYIYSIKDSVKFEWIKDKAQLRGAVEYVYYDFKATGKSLNQLRGSIDYDLGDENLITTKDMDIKSANQTVGGYLENRITLGDIKIIPGVRSDYFKRSGDTTFDPRGLISYEFRTDTTVSLAGGRYSSFFQTNPFFFADNPEYSTYGKKLKPERAYHGSTGVEQVLGLYTFSLEGFYNYFYDLAVAYAHVDDEGDFVEGQNSGESKAYGAELMIRKDQRKETNDIFGWLSYTYTQSKFKSGITGNVFQADGTETSEIFDPNGDKWINGTFEREHSLKLVMGYKYNAHTFTSRFQLYTSLPYTPIDGNNPPQHLPLLDIDRYSPQYSDNVNSKHFPVDHRLDVRYSYQTNYKWGHIKFYFEIINIYGIWYRPKNQVVWKYNQPYQKGVNPTITEQEGLSIIPNLGLEIKF